MNKEQKFPAVLPMVFVDCGVQPCDRCFYRFVRIVDQRGIVYFGGAGKTLIEAISELAEDIDSDKRSMPKGQGAIIREMVSRAMDVAKSRPDSYTPVPDPTEKGCA